MSMWNIKEYRGIEKTCRHLPPNVLKKYELWKSIVSRHGPEKLREFPGFHDEKLKGDRAGQRSSRLNLQYRVIYQVEREIVMVYVIEITPHDY
jgi:plasmid maintenance system killer protein